MKKERKPPSSEEEKIERYRRIFDSAGDGLIIIDMDTGLVIEANPAACKMHGYNLNQFIGLPLKAFIHPDSQFVFTEQIKMVRSDGLFDALTLHECRDGATFFAEWCGKSITFQGIPCLLGIVRDVSKRIHVEQSLQQRVETRTHEQAMLLEISHTLASTLELRPGLILDQLREIIEYDHAGLFGLKDSTLVILAMRGMAQWNHSAPIRIHIQGPETLATLFNGHQPICISDMWTDSPQTQFFHSLLEDGAAVLLDGMRSWLWVPLAVKSRIIGGLGVAHAKRSYFTPHYAALTLSVADQAALTMVNAELYENAQALAVLEERQRLARNLHDAVNQSLFSAGLIAEVLPRLWEKDQQQARQSLEDLRRMTQGAMAEMRALLVELRPSTLTDADLGDLLRLLGNAFTGRTNVPTRVTAQETVVLPSEVQVAIYRICQEALNNVAKHAGASMVEITLEHEKNAIELSIRDDGRGFDPEQIASGHYGLSMMRERAETMGVELSILSQPGHGTELTIHWTESKKLEAL